MFVYVYAEHTTYLFEIVVIASVKLEAQHFEIILIIQCITMFIGYFIVFITDVDIT